MIPSWLRLYSKKKKVLTDEQRAILKALADPVENKFLYDSWRYENKYKNEVEK